MATMTEVWNTIERLDEFEREELIGIIKRRERTRFLVNDLIGIARHCIDEKMTPYDFANSFREAIVSVKDELDLLVGLERNTIDDAIKKVASKRKKLAERLNKARRRALSLDSRNRHAAKRVADADRRFAKLQALIDADPRMPPVPEPTAKAFDIAWNVPKFAGVYFAYDSHGDVAYVGESQNVPERLKHHHAVSPNEWVGYLELLPDERFFAECYYIWLLRPVRNREGMKTIRARKNA